HADAWFDGITPTLTAAVWVGYPQAEIPMENVHGIAVAGGTFPATIWKLFMESAIGPTPVREFPPALSEPIWHSWTPGSYSGGPPPPPALPPTPPGAPPPRGRPHTRPPPPPPPCPAKPPRPPPRPRWGRLGFTPPRSNNRRRRDEARRACHRARRATVPA